MAEETTESSPSGENALALSDLADLASAARRAAVRRSVTAGLLLSPAVLGMVGEFGLAGLWSIPVVAIPWGVLIAPRWYKYARASTRVFTYRRLLSATEDSLRDTETPELPLIAPGSWIESVAEPAVPLSQAPAQPGDDSQVIVRLHDRRTGTELGIISESHVQFLVDHLEVSEGRGCYIDLATLAFLEEVGADRGLADLLRRSLEGRDALVVEWDDPQSGAF